MEDPQRGVLEGVGQGACARRSAFAADGQAGRHSLEHVGGTDAPVHPARAAGHRRRPEARGRTSSSRLVNAVGVRGERPQREVDREQIVWRTAKAAIGAYSCPRSGPARRARRSTNAAMAPNSTTTRTSRTGTPRPARRLDWLSRARTRWPGTDGAHRPQRRMWELRRTGRWGGKAAPRARPRTRTDVARSDLRGVPTDS